MQPIGRNKFLSTPKLIADFLGLPDPEKYTGHSFRRTSATLLANSGADIITLKQHGGWRSTNVVEGYVENSISRKRKIGSLITNQLTSSSSTIISSQTKLVNITATESVQPFSQLEPSRDVPKSTNLQFPIDVHTSVNNNISTSVETSGNIETSTNVQLSSDIQTSANLQISNNLQQVHKDEPLLKKNKGNVEFNFSNCSVNIYYK